MRTRRHAVLLALWIGLFWVGRLDAQARYVSPQNTPGSLLVFPLVDTGKNRLTLISITNTNRGMRFAPGLPYREGDVDLLVRSVHADGSVTERTASLPPGGTTAFLASGHQASHEGYVYVVARDPFSGDAIDFDFLLGQSITVDLAVQSAYALPCVSFRSLAKENSSPTGLSPVGHVLGDVGADNQLYLDGQEFSAVYDRISIPMFFEEIEGTLETDVVLLTTLPKHYRVDLEIDVFNNHEVSFTRSHSFHVWDRRTVGELAEIARMPHLNGSNPTGEVRTGWARVRPTHAVNLITGQATQAPGLMGAFVVRALGSAYQGLAAASLMTGEGSRTAGPLPFLN